VSNGEKCPGCIRRFGPWRQRQIRRRRVHCFAAFAAAVAAGAVADGAMGSKKRSPGLPGLRRRQQFGGRARRRVRLTSRNDE
jgi:hypothetical protein